MINLVIWGIRDGFKERLFNLNDVQSEFSAIPRDDLFRDLSNIVRTSSYFVISRTRNFNVFTIIDTKIREYKGVELDRRGGFVAFSYILDRDYFFSESPIRVLQSFVEFYKIRVGDGNSNNFSREEASHIVNQLQIERRELGVRDEKCFSYFSTITEIEELFVGESTYAAYSELILLPEERAAQSIAEVFKERGRGFKIVNLVSEKTKERDRNTTAKLAEQEESKIKDVYYSGDKVQAYEAYVNSKFRSQFSKSFSEVLDAYNKGNTEQKRLDFEREHDRKIEFQIVDALQKVDLEKALSIYKSLYDPKNLDRSTIEHLAPALKEIEYRREIQRKKEIEKKRKEEEKRKNRKILVLASSIGVIISLGMISFFMEIPAGLYADIPGPVVDTIKQVKDTVVVEVDKGDTIPPLTPRDRLLRGDTLFAGRFPDNQPLDSSFVYYITTTKEWMFCKKRTGSYEIVRWDSSKDSLKSRFKMIDESISPTPGEDMRPNIVSKNGDVGRGKPKNPPDVLPPDKNGFYEKIYNEYKNQTNIPNDELRKFIEAYNEDKKSYIMGMVTDWKLILEKKKKK